MPKKYTVCATQDYLTQCIHAHLKVAMLHTATRGAIHIDILHDTEWWLSDDPSCFLMLVFLNREMSDPKLFFVNYINKPHNIS